MSSRVCVTICSLKLILKFLRDFSKESVFPEPRDSVPCPSAVTHRDNRVLECHTLSLERHHLGTMASGSKWCKTWLYVAIQALNAVVLLWMAIAVLSVFHSWNFWEAGILQNIAWFIPCAAFPSSLAEYFYALNWSPWFIHKVGSSHIELFSLACNTC